MSEYTLNEGLEYIAVRKGGGVVLTRKKDGADVFFQGEEADFCEGEWSDLDPLAFDQHAGEYDHVLVVAEEVAL